MVAGKKSGLPQWGEMDYQVLLPLQGTRNRWNIPHLTTGGIQSLVGTLTKVSKASVALRHVPQAWSITKVVFISKPGINGHIRARDFRPISPTYFLLKTLD
jgi:hypothetical protein